MSALSWHNGNILKAEVYTSFIGQKIATSIADGLIFQLFAHIFPRIVSIHNFNPRSLMPYILPLHISLRGVLIYRRCR